MIDIIDSVHKHLNYLIERIIDENCQEFVTLLNDNEHKSCASPSKFTPSLPMKSIPSELRQYIDYFNYGMQHHYVHLKPKLYPDSQGI